MVGRLLLVVILVGLAAVPLVAQDTCGLEPRLVVGERGQVTPGSPNNVRSQPSRSANLVGQIPGGHLFVVRDGPVCADNFQWWQIEFSLATGSEGQFVEAQLPTDEQPWNHSPAYVEFTFAGYPDEAYREYDAPSLRVYEATAFEGIDNMLGDAGRYAFEGITQVLAERPDLYSFGLFQNRLPDDAPNVGHTVLAQMRYLDFLNGSGYRYVTAYAQAFVGPDNNRLMYRYLGMTADGVYFVSARFPIDAPQLPKAFEEPADDNVIQAFQAYALDAATLFDSIPPEQYTPDLSQLDALVASLVVGE
jgi:hypothetical protein